MEARIFYKRVQERANLSDDVSTRRAVKTVLQSLHWRIPEGEANDIEATLPPELQREWRGNLAMRFSKKMGRVNKMNKEQFLNRVRTMNRLGTKESAERLSMAVIHVLKEAIPTGETKDMLAQLPLDLRSFIKAA